MFENLEKELPLEKLIRYRNWALIEVRVEAKRFYASRYYQHLFQNKVIVVMYKE